MEKRAMTIIFRAGVVFTVFALSAIATNAQTLQNGGFETAGGLYTNTANISQITTGALSWIQFNNAFRTSVGDSGIVRSGSYTLKCFGDQTWIGEGAYQRVGGASAGQKWVLSCYGLTPSSDPLTNTSIITPVQPFGLLQIAFQDIHSNSLGSANAPNIVGSIRDAWQFTTITGTCPVGTAFVVAYVFELGYSAGASGAVYFDDVTLVNLNAPIVTNFFHEAITSGNQVCWMSTTNASYQAQFSLNNVTWVNVGSTIPGDGTSNCTFDASGSFGGRFYRVLEVK